MNNQKTIPCVFCQGTGENPHFTGSCPVCKGKGKNMVVGKYMACGDCRGTGQKRGTTLTCYTCGGLGVVSDTREEFENARKAIKKAQEEMEIEKEEFREKPLTRKAKPRQLRDEESSVGESEEDIRFCQCCAKKVNKNSTVKVCLKCFKKVKKAKGV